jgi:SET domain-containing protein
MTLLDKHLVVAKSTLPNAGNGLFTKKFIPKGARITAYRGKVTTWKEADYEDNGYIYYVKRYHVIDARKHKKVLARYSNDARGLKRVKGITNNSHYVEDGLNVFIEAKKNILPGQEILVPYGKEYWDAIRHNQKVSEI